MARSSKAKAKAEDTESSEPLKSDSQGYRGGLDVQLSRVCASGNTVESELSAYIKENLDQEIQNQEKLVKNIARSERQYIGRKKGKSFPWVNCSNISVPETRKNVDTVLVRILDAIFNRRKIFIVKANKPELMEQARAIEKALDWFFKHVIRLKEKLLPAITQGLKSGTGIEHITWESKREAIYRYATPEELADKSVHKYKLEGSKDFAVKDVQTYYEGPQWVALPREDFIISSDATNIKDAKLVGFRSYLTESEIRLKERQGLYRKGSAEKLIAPDKHDEVKESRAENQGKELKPTVSNLPYEIWTLWLKYDVDDDGEGDSIVVTFHPYSNSIMRCLYNPVFTSNRPFVALRPWPIEFSFDGEGLCNMMYNLQEAIDAIQNQRIDRGTLLNTINTITRTGIGLDNFKLAPGKNWVCEENPTEDVFRVIQMPDVPPSQFQEQANLASLGMQMCGISPGMQGISTSERPVAKETFALLEESNKKFKNMIDNVRDGLTEGAYQTLELMAQYQPTLRYKEDQQGEWVEQTVDIPIMSLREGFDIELAAATEVLSQEVRREIWLNVFMLIRQYQTDLGGMAQMLTSPQVPSDMKKVIMEANRIGVELLKNILLDYDLPNAEQLVLDLVKVVDVQKVVMASPDLQAQMGPPGGPGGSPNGPGGGPPGGPQGPPSNKPPGPSARPPGPGLSPMGGGPGGPPPGMVPAGM
jgi:hypothetical protein